MRILLLQRKKRKNRRRGGSVKRILERVRERENYASFLHGAVTPFSLETRKTVRGPVWSWIGGGWKRLVDGGRGGFARRGGARRSGRGRRNVETSSLGVTRTEEERFLSHVETPWINIPVARSPFIGVRRLVTGNSRVHVCFLLLSLLTFFFFFFFNYFLAANALLLPVSTLTAVINRWMMIPSLEQVWKRGFLCFTELEWKGKWNFFFPSKE